MSAAESQFCLSSRFLSYPRVRFIVLCCVQSDLFGMWEREAVYSHIGSSRLNPSTAELRFGFLTSQFPLILVRTDDVDAVNKIIKCKRSHSRV